MNWKNISTLTEKDIVAMYRIRKRRKSGKSNKTIKTYERKEFF